MPEFEIEYGMFHPNGDLDHVKLRYSAENEAQAVQFFFREHPNIHLVNKPIVNGWYTLENTNSPVGKMVFGSWLPITDKEERKRILGSLEYSALFSLDMGDFFFFGEDAHLMENRLKDPRKTSSQNESPETKSSDSSWNWID